MIRARRGEGGLFRGCCLGLLLLLVLLGLGGFVVDRAIAAPDLGAPPGGRDDGGTQQAVAIALGTQLAAQLFARPHAAVTISEHDLTLIAVIHNPHPDEYRNIQVRSRNGLVDVSAQRSYGPVSLTAVGYVALGLDMSAGPPQVVANVTGIDVGALHLPGWVKDRFLGDFSPTVQINQLFQSSAALQVFRDNLECVQVVPEGVRIGVHRPETAADTTTCSG